MMSNPPPPPPDDEQPPQRRKRPLPIIYPDADPDNANWLRILAQRRQEQEQQKKDKHTDK